MINMTNFKIEYDSIGPYCDVAHTCYGHFEDKIYN